METFQTQINTNEETSTNTNLNTSLNKTILPSKKKKTGRKIIKTFFGILFTLVFLAFLICSIFSYLNFTKVQNKEQPSNYRQVLEYEKDGKDVTVYDYYLYKIVKVQNQAQTEVTLKLWFLEDLNK